MAKRRFLFFVLFPVVVCLFFSFSVLVFSVPIFAVCSAVAGFAAVGFGGAVRCALGALEVLSGVWPVLSCVLFRTLFLVVVLCLVSPLRRGAAWESEETGVGIRSKRKKNIGFLKCLCTGVGAGHLSIEHRRWEAETPLEFVPSTILYNW